MRARSDEEIVSWAKKNGRVLITRDVGIASVQRFPPESHQGIVLVRFPEEVGIETVKAEVARAIRSLAGEALRGAVVVIEPGQIRIRRAWETIR